MGIGSGAKRPNLSEVGGVSPLWIPNREVVFRVRVVRDVRAKLCASPPWFLASDPGPCPPLLLSSSPPPRRGPAGVPAGVLAGVPVSRRVSWPGPVGVPAGLPVFRRVSRRGPVLRCPGVSRLVPRCQSKQK